MAATPPQTDAALRKAFTGIKVIDTDTHLSEPFDLWTSRAPGKFKDRVPQVKEIKDKPTWGSMVTFPWAVPGQPA